ncbi:MAG: cation:proton antiporter [Thermoanaerobaculia bacterium]|nr:cation:proton antiporter [Thermoanaerobaculia bacterium]
MSYLDWLVPLAAFALVCLASHRIGRFFIGARLPLITGFLAAGILAGPFVLDLLPAADLRRLRFVDEAALAFIAFAAGSELHLRELRGRLRSIRWTALGLVAVTFTTAAATVYSLAERIPFLAGLGPEVRLAAALLAGAVLVARSPSSAIAVINELRARGPFTKSVLGVIVVMDVMVILIFAVNSSLAGAVLSGSGFRPGLVAWVLFEVVLSVVAGVIAGRIIPWLTRVPGPRFLKGMVLLASGYGIFLATDALRHASQDALGGELFLEPLLVAMVAAFTITNFSDRRTSFQQTLDLTGPPVYVAFFTLAGASLDFETLTATWTIAVALFGACLAAVFVGAFLGGTVAGDPLRLRRIAGFAFITQAGISLGLAKEVAVEFPPWGEAFATMMIAVIVLNQIFGPPLFKMALQLAGEAHVKAGKHDLRGTPLALIFGLETEGLALARQLSRHGWRTRVVTRRGDRHEEVDEDDVEIAVVPDLSVESLRAIGADGARALVAMMSEEDNYRICEAAYEEFGTRIVVARSTDHSNWPRLQELGASVVDPGVAVVSLFDQLVRSPAVGAMVLDAESEQDVVDLEITSHDLDGVALRDVHLPLDTLVLSVRRDGATLISHGYTRLRRGDVVTVLGSPASLDEVALKFS